jgi:hypothetical protein
VVAVAAAVAPTAADKITVLAAAVAAEKFAMAECLSHQVARLLTQSVLVAQVEHQGLVEVLAIQVRQAKTRYLVNFVLLAVVVELVDLEIPLVKPQVAMEVHHQHHRRPLLALLVVLILVVDRVLLERMH